MSKNNPKFIKGQIESKPYIEIGKVHGETKRNDIKTLLGLALELCHTDKSANGLGPTGLSQLSGGK